MEQGTGMGVVAKCKGRPAASKVLVFSDYVTPGIRAALHRVGTDAAILKSDTGAFIDYCAALTSSP